MKSNKEKTIDFFAGKTNYIPKGEILVDEAFLNKRGFKGLEAYLKYLNADIACIKVEKTAPKTQWAEQGFFLFGLLSGPLEALFDTPNPNICWEVLARKPQEAKVILEENIKKSLALAQDAVSNGFEGFVLADDLAGQKGLMVSPKFLGEVYFPLICRFIDELRSKGFKGPLFFHSDGNILPLLPYIKEAGFNGVQGLQPSCGINPALLDNKEYGDLFFWGNFEFENKEYMKSTTEISREVPTLLENWQKHGKYIFGSSGGIHVDIPPQPIILAYSLVDEFNQEYS